MGNKGYRGEKNKDIRENFVQEDGSIFTVGGDDKKRNWMVTVPGAKPWEFITKDVWLELSDEDKNNYRLIDEHMKVDPDIDLNLYYAVKKRSFFDLPNIIPFVGCRQGSSDRWYNYAYILHDKDTVSQRYYESLPIKDRDRYILLPEDNEGTRYPFRRSVDKWALKRMHYHCVLAFQDWKSFATIRKQFGTDLHLMFCQNVRSSYCYLTHDTPDAIRRCKYRYDKIEIISNNIDFFETHVANTIAFEIFDPNMIGKYFFVDGANSYLDINLRFGTVQTQRWLQTINSFAALKRELLDIDYLDPDDPDRRGGRSRLTEKHRYCIWDNGLRFITEDDLPKSAADMDIVYSVKLWNKLQFSQFGLHYIRWKLISSEEITEIENMILYKNHRDMFEKYKLHQSDLVLTIREYLGLMSQEELKFCDPEAYPDEK